MERRSGSDRRVADRRQGRERAARILAILGPDFRQAKTTPSEGTTVLNAENAPRLLAPAVNESSRFFGEHIEVEVPDAFYKTEERLREIGFTRAEPLVLPQQTLFENDPLWEGKVRPTELFWKFIRYDHLKPEAAILEQGVSLIDGRPKPNYQDIEQRYEDDEFMEDLIKELRRKGKIQRNRFVPLGSRFEVSPWEIEKVIMPKLTRVIGKDALGSEGRVMNNPYKIFNIVGNMCHPEWGSTTTSEWFGDKLVNDTLMSDQYLFGGNSSRGGLADVYDSESGDRANYIGFRPWINFSSKT